MPTDLGERPPPVDPAETMTEDDAAVFRTLDMRRFGDTSDMKVEPPEDADDLPEGRE
jgi:hypothetical protein